MQIKKWIPKFPIDSKKRMCFSMLFIAPRYSGKTYMIEKLYNTYWKDKFDMVIVVTTDANGVVYDKFITNKKKKIITDGSLDFIQKIKRKNASNLKLGKMPINTLLIFDDTATKKQVYNDEISQLYTNGRHFNISIVYTSQTPVLCATTWRENSDIIILFKIKTTKYINYAIDNLIGGVVDTSKMSKNEEKKFYLDIFSDVTSKLYTALVLNFRDSEMFWYKS